MAVKPRPNLPALLQSACSGAISSSEAQDTMGQILARVASGERVILTRYGEAQAVLIPVRDFCEHFGAPDASLADLEQEFDERFLTMQRPIQRKAVERLFSMSTAEMGRAARKAAQATKARKKSG